MSHYVTIWSNVSVAYFFAPDNGTYLWSQILIFFNEVKLHLPVGLYSWTEYFFGITSSLYLSSYHFKVEEAWIEVFGG